MPDTSGRRDPAALLEEFARLVQELEAGKADVAADALKALIDDLCAGPWETPAQREEAQALVLRAWRLGRRAGRPS